MSEPYIGQIMIFAFNFAPRNWAFCNGALMAIAQNQALFSIVGTTYGGNGTTNFGLPNIQDQTVMSIGQGPGLSNYVLGQASGVQEVTLTQQTMPGHSHFVFGIGGNAPSDYKLAPASTDWIGSRESATGKDFLFGVAPGAGENFGASVIAISGGSLPHQNEQPYLGMNYCIALYGIFPSRN